MATDSDRQAFLKANRFCILGTLRRDGRARLSPMSYGYDDGKLYITTRATRAGALTAKRDPRVTVCCFNPDQRRPYVSVTGRAEIISDEALFVNVQQLIRGRELSEDDVAKERRRFADEGRVILRITPEEMFDSIR
ncbi:MAG TPA: TIGR03618 family F420-dependent PPOX class oxidoreductase [Dehalococcoidia bacterium]|nr:TIGR03618 family F420-dependent PPOX class oxidoreductase [Dehalococcoidia bacterium]